jgi:3-hydroxyanthranilate 3,4-dioxygenase
MALERKKTLNVFKDAKAAWGSYDDYPVGPRGTDPMPHLSRNRLPQPFFVVSETDQVLIQMAGHGHIHFVGIEPDHMTLTPGDTVYIPAGVPNRVSPDGENLQIRLKAEPPSREAVVWYCPQCAAEVCSKEIAAGIVQDQYWNAVKTFNDDSAPRTCKDCGAVHPPVELGDIAWLDVAKALREED